MAIKVTGDTLTNAENMTQVERDALLIEVYQSITAQHVKVTFVHNVMEQLDKLVSGLMANPPSGMMGKLVSGMMPTMPERPVASKSGLHLPPPPPLRG